MVFLMCGAAVALLSFFTGLVWSPEGEAENHPYVKALISVNWQIGRKPPYKWDA